MKCLTVFLLLGLFCLPVLGKEERQVTVATLEFSPYVSAKLPNNGWAWEVLEETFSRRGYEAVLKIVPWARAVELTKSGQVDALYLANKNPEREQWAMFSQPVGEEISVAFKHVHKDMTIQSPADLKRYRVVGLRGAHVVNKLRKAGVVMDDIDSLKQGLQMLFYKRADVMVSDRYVTNYLLNHELPEKYQFAIEFVDTPMDANQLHLAVSKKVPDHEILVASFDAGLTEIIEDGTYQHILEKHGF